MRILQLHSDFIEYEPVKKEIANAEAAEKKAKRLDDVLVLLTCVEAGDDEAVARQAMDETKKFLKTLKANRILLYPYAHLSGDLAEPAVALAVMKKMEDYSKSLGVETFRAPFGWCKRFSISVKGHPLAEQSREIPSYAGAPAERGEKEKKAVKTKTRTKEQKDVVLKKSRIVAEELPENDHRRLGEKLDMFSFHEVAAGMPFFHDNGMTVLNLLIEFWREEHRKAGYEEVKTPIILNRSLWEISGHWDHYKDNMYFTKVDEDDYAIKPMNCPGGIMIFKERNRSYKELPIRMAELGVVHRHELSGVLSGLFRVRMFTQDDAHIFMREDQIKDEIIGVIRLTDKFYRTFNLDYHVELSTRPENSIGTDGQWEAAERGLKEALESEKIKYKLNPGEGAFYGPKIDFHVKDAMGRTWQCGTIQLDMTMPEKFDLDYIGEDNKPHRVVMIHRVIYGALERFLGILIEHFKGNLPAWLSPIQVSVLSLTEKQNDYAKGVAKILEDKGVRVGTDMGESTIEHKIREAQLQKVPYMLVLGKKEEDSKSVSVRSRDGKVKYDVGLDDFVEQLLDEIEKKTIK